MLNNHFTYQLKNIKKKINTTRKYCSLSQATDSAGNHSQAPDSRSNTELKYKHDLNYNINNGEDQRYNITENDKLIVNNKEVTLEELFYKKKLLDYLENNDININCKLEMIEKNNHLFDDKYKYENNLFKGLDFDDIQRTDQIIMAQDIPMVADSSQSATNLSSEQVLLNPGELIN
jgi:hypothetical protein